MYDVKGMLDDEMQMMSVCEEGYTSCMREKNDVAQLGRGSECR